MAKRKAADSRNKKATAKKGVAKEKAESKRGTASSAGKKKAARSVKAKPTKSAATKASRKKASPKPKTATAKRGGKKVAKVARTAAVKKKPAIKVNPVAKKATKLKKTAAKSPEPAPTNNRISLQWGSTTIELVEDTKKTPKTKLTKRELREFERMLIDKRRELVGDMENLRNDSLNSNSTGGASSSVPLHMADVGSDNWEQEFTLGLIENERSLVREIDEALARVESRTYGVCLATHMPIDKARLRAKPWAKYCIEYARLRELGRVP